VVHEVTPKMKKNTDEILTYETAWSELQIIVADLQSGNTAIDHLSAKIERAAELVRFCREKLRTTEASLEKLG
jgi:exodeoxyribonuclease VII small subunit